MVDTELSLRIFVTSLQKSCALDFTFKVEGISKLWHDERGIGAFVHKYGCSLVYFFKDVVDYRKKTKLFQSLFIWLILTSLFEGFLSL